MTLKTEWKQPMSKAAVRAVNDALHQLHPDELVCVRYRREARKRERTIANLFARAHALIERAEVLVEVGDPNDEVGEVLAAVATHKVMIRELLDE
jgi:hypothetical protein